MIQNQYGLGVGTGLGLRQYIITPGCPLHEYTTAYLDESPRDLDAKGSRLQRRASDRLRTATSSRSWREFLFKGNSSFARDRSGLPIRPESSQGFNGPE